MFKLFVRRRRSINDELLAAVLDRDADAVLAALSRGANPSFSHRETGTPALLLAFHRHTTTFPGASPGERSESFYRIEVDLPSLDLLLSHGATTKVSDWLGNSPLAIAAEWHYLDVVRMLLKHGADPDFGGDTRLTPLMRAVLFDDNPQSNRPVIEALLDAGASVNAQNEQGVTALIYAVSNGKQGAVRLLLERGADPNMRDAGGDTALAIARRQAGDRSMPAIIASLEGAGAVE